jgi:hypothetical protein
MDAEETGVAGTFPLSMVQKQLGMKNRWAPIIELARHIQTRPFVSVS